MTSLSDGKDDDLLSRALAFTPLRLSFFLALVLLALGPLFDLPHNIGATLDWQIFQFYDEVARKSVMEFHQFPMWNPYFCGGTTLIGNPSSTYFVPTFPLLLFFGTTLGERLADVVVVTVACEGGYRLARHLGLSAAPSLLLAVVFPFFGRTFHWLHDGQYGLVGTTLEMWILYGWLRGLDRPVYLALGAAFLAWLISFRGLQPAPQLAIALFLWAIGEGVRRYRAARQNETLLPSLRRGLRPAMALAQMGVLSFGLAAIRLVPMLEAVIRFPRVVKETAWRTFSEVFVEIYAIPIGTKGYSDPGYAYVGFITYAFFVGAVIFARPRKRATIPLLIALAFMMICLGYHGDFSPYPWLHQLPLYRSLRNPTLYAFTGALFVVLPAAIALDELRSFLRSRKAKLARWVGAILIPAITVGAIVDVGARGHWVLTLGVFPNPPPARVEQEFRQARGNRFDQTVWPIIDRGSISCYDEIPWPTSDRLRPDLPAEEFLADPSAGEARRVSWSPNKIAVAVKLTKPATLLINQNWATGWHASAGTVRAEGGLLAVDLPAGERTVVLSFWPGAASVAIVIILLSCGVVYWMLRRDRRQRAARRDTIGG